MANIGKFAPAVLKNSPAPTTPDEVDLVVSRNVIGCYNDNWLRFDNMEIAKQVMPISQHHRIFVDSIDLQRKLGVRRTMELGRKFAVKSLQELWSKLLLNAYDPQLKYDDIVQLETKRRSARAPKVKRYKRKLAYTFHFDDKSQNHINVYARLTPQACALVDLIAEWVTTRDTKAFTEAELEGLLTLRKDVLRTRQDPWRIFQYYRGKLIGAGFLRYAKGD
jgi:hypothetical protein